MNCCVSVDDLLEQLVTAPLPKLYGDVFSVIDLHAGVIFERISERLCRCFYLGFGFAVTSGRTSCTATSCKCSYNHCCSNYRCKNSLFSCITSFFPVFSCFLTTFSVPFGLALNLLLIYHVHGNSSTYFLLFIIFSSFCTCVLSIFHIVMLYFFISNQSYIDFFTMLDYNIHSL